MLFEWADAFNPHRKRLPWLFEHKSRLSLGVVRAWRSWWMALIPSRFWSRVTPAHGTSREVVLWPLVLVVSMLLAGGAVRAGYLYATDWAGAWTAWGGGPPKGWKRAEAIAVEAWGQPLWLHRANFWNSDDYWRTVARVYAGPAAVVGASLVCLLTLMCLTTSRRLCGVKASHVVRAAVYRTAPLGVLYLLWLLHSLFGPNSPWGWDALNAARLTAMALVVLWGFAWWRTVILTGWVMPRSRLAAHLIALCDVLAGVAIYAELDPFSVGRLFS